MGATRVGRAFCRPCCMGYRDKSDVYIGQRLNTYMSKMMYVTKKAVSATLKRFPDILISSSRPSILVLPIFDRSMKAEKYKRMHNGSTLRSNLCLIRVSIVACGFMFDKSACSTSSRCSLLMGVDMPESETLQLFSILVRWSAGEVCRLNDMYSQ